jgi:predicted DNA binding CopG/RHH family protein
MAKQKLSEIESEAAEARWFEENQDRLLKLFEQAEKEGALRVGGKSVGITLSKTARTVKKPPSQKVMLRIPAGDVERARLQAAVKGIGYQTYMKMLLHAGLEREGNVRRRA